MLRDHGYNYGRGARVNRKTLKARRMRLRKILKASWCAIKPGESLLVWTMDSARYIAGPHDLIRHIEGNLVVTRSKHPDLVMQASTLQRFDLYAYGGLIEFQREDDGSTREFHWSPKTQSIWLKETDAEGNDRFFEEVRR